MRKGTQERHDHMVVRIVTMLLLVMGTLAAVAGWTGKAHAQDVTKSDASIRFVHASPGAPNVDILVDGQPFVQGLAFGEPTEYSPIADGDHKIQVVPTGQTADAALIDTDLNVDGGDAYIFAAMNRLNDIEGKVFQVNQDQVDEGKARLRLIHASPDAGSLKVAVTGGDTLFEGVDFKDATDYKDLDAGTYSLDLTGDDDRLLLSAQNLAVTAGDVYDVFVVGQIADNSLALLPLVTSVSVPCGEVLGLQGGAEDACLRIVHVVPGGPAVDVYINDSPVVQGLSYGTATDFVALPAGDDHKLQVVATGGTPGDDDIVDDNINIDGRSAYDIFLTGNPDDVEAKNTELDLAAVAEGQSRLRAIHAAPDLDGVDIAIADGPTLFEGVDFRDVTDYQTVDAGTYSVQLKDGDNVLLTGDVTLETGMVYDIVAIGRNDDNTLALLLLAAPALVQEGGVATPESQGTAGVGTAEATVVAGTPESGA